MRLFKLFLAFTILLIIANIAFTQTTRKRTAKKTTTVKVVKPTPTPMPKTVLTDSEIDGGLKEALFTGVKENGFLDDVRVKIPLPPTLVKLEKGMRIAGQGAKVDEFVASMNHAAEKAVPVAVDVFVDSIKQMTFTDAKNILFSKQEDSATQFFRKTTEENLRGKFRPMVEKFTTETGVTQKYKGMVGKLGAFSGILGKDATDLDGYVTQKALDGLFFMVAVEEKKIRKNPLGTASDLLKKVFGSIFK
jgi:Protein of unknown function (DUF4197)